jgi:hypothetical protein
MLIGFPSVTFPVNALGSGVEAKSTLTGILIPRLVAVPFQCPAKSKGGGKVARARVANTAQTARARSNECRLNNTWISAQNLNSCIGTPRAFSHSALKS